MPNLSPQDRRAVDAILMNGLLYNPSSTAPAAAAADGVGERIKQVAKVLHLLDAMPAEEPPAGLADRTLSRIVGSGVVAPSDAPSVGDAGDRPVA